MTERSNSSGRGHSDRSYSNGDCQLGPLARLWLPSREPSTWVRKRQHICADDQGFLGQVTKPVSLGSLFSALDSGFWILDSGLPHSLTRSRSSVIGRVEKWVAALPAIRLVRCPLSVVRCPLNRDMWPTESSSRNRIINKPPSLQG